MHSKEMSIVVTCLVFSVSCVSREVQVTENYYETEYRTEQYTDIEKVVTVVEGEDQSDEVIEEKTVTKERQVPYQAEKQRTVIQTREVPVWGVIFGK